MNNTSLIKLGKHCYWNDIDELVIINGSIVKLSPLSRECLKLFVHNRNRPLMSKDIFSYLYKDEKTFNSKAIRSLMSNLRNKIPCLKIVNQYGGIYLLEKYRDVSLDFHDYLFDIIDQAKNGITITDPNQIDNPIIYVNEAFVDIFGYSSDEIIGKNCRFLQGNDDNQPEVSEIRQAINNKEAIQRVIRNYNKSGKLIYNEINISPIFDKKSLELKYFLGVQKDVTDVYCSG